MITYAANTLDDFKSALALLSDFNATNGFVTPAAVSPADVKVRGSRITKPAAAPVVEAQAPGKLESGPAPEAVSAPSPASASPAAPSVTATTSPTDNTDLYDLARAAAKAKLASNAAFRTRITALISTHGVDAIGKIPRDAIAAFTTQVTAMEI